MNKSIYEKLDPIILIHLTTLLRIIEQIYMYIMNRILSFYINKETQNDLTNMNNGASKLWINLPTHEFCSMSTTVCI